MFKTILKITTCAVVVPMLGFAGVGEFKEEGPIERFVVAQSSGTADSVVVGASILMNEAGYYSVIKRNVEISACVGPYDSAVKARSGRFMFSSIVGIEALKSPYPEDSEQYTRYDAMLKNISDWKKTADALSALPRNKDTVKIVHEAITALLNEISESLSVWWPDKVVPADEEFILNWIQGHFYRFEDLITKKDEAEALLSSESETQRFSDEIGAFIDDYVAGLDIKEMVSTDTAGVTHPAYVFSDRGTKPTSIIYYVHGGPGSSINDPHAFKFTSTFIRENADIPYSTILGTSHETLNLTLRTLPFIKSLVQSGCMVVCLNYPGSIMHGSDWCDKDYEYDERICDKAKTLSSGYLVSGLKPDFEITLAEIISNQIKDLTPRIRFEYKLDAIPVTYLGHSLGATIGATLPMCQPDFLKDYISSLAIACPCVHYIALTKPGSETLAFKQARLEAIRQAERTIPITIIAGGKDSVTPPEEARLICGAITAGAHTGEAHTGMATYHEVADAEHAPHNVLNMLPLSVDKVLVAKFIKDNPGVNVFAMDEDSIPEDVKVHIRAIKENMPIAIKNYNEYLGIVLRAVRQTA